MNRIVLLFFLVRRGGLEPPRCYPLAPQASASANSAISAYVKRATFWLGSGGRQRPGQL
jgi:hypothetical protein